MSDGPVFKRYASLAPFRLPLLGACSLHRDADARFHSLIDHLDRQTRPISEIPACRWLQVEHGGPSRGIPRGPQEVSRGGRRLRWAGRGHPVGSRCLRPSPSGRPAGVDRDSPRGLNNKDHVMDWQRVISSWLVKIVPLEAAGIPTYLGKSDPIPVRIGAGRNTGLRPAFPHQPGHHRAP
jgi:hypothetical protein